MVALELAQRRPARIVRQHISFVKGPRRARRDDDDNLERRGGEGDERSHDAALNVEHGERVRFIAHIVTTWHSRTDQR